MEMVSPIVKDQLNRVIIEMGDFAMKKKTIIISGIAAVLVIGSVVFCFAVKGDSTQPAEVAQTVTEAVEAPTIEIPEEVVEEPEVVEEVEEVPEVKETSEEVSSEEPVETPEVQETSEEGSIVEVAETSSEVSEDSGVPTQTEEVKPEEVKPAETKQEVAKAEPNVNQISTDEASQALINQILADGGSWGVPSSTSTAHGFESSGGAAAQIIVE